MKKITLEDVVRALELRKHVVEVESSIAKRAREAIERSLELIR
jgi:quinolinate synthase